MEDESKTTIIYYDDEGRLVSKEDATRASIFTFDEAGNPLDHVWGNVKETIPTEGDSLRNAASILDSIIQAEMEEEQSSKGMGSK